ncbi:MAG TPA: DUF366 family protein [Syntrophomonadaceae bacterium]|nr:DUF366 family protein [Syntrophomonadaceae bacterium]
METMYIEERIDYNGQQLTPHWIYNNYKLIGDAAVAFVGEVHVPIDNMVDLSDVMDQAFIYSPLMLNFIIEHFNHDLNLAIYRQRLFMVCIKEELEQFEIPVSRRGDDLYISKAKLSVSIATASTTSTLIHVGLNIETTGAPVKAAGLKDLAVIDFKSFAENCLLRYKRELEQIYEARCKVRAR